MADLQPKTEPPGAHSFIAGVPYLLDQAIAHWNAKLAERLKSIGLSFEQWRLLLVTAELGEMSIRELSQATLVPHSTIGRWIAAMEADGLLQRAAHPGDKRAVWIGITSAGRALYERALPLAAASYDEGVSCFTAAEVASLQNLLHRLHANLR